MTQFREKPILLFDGVCNLCNRWVNYVIDRDPAAHITFGPLQSDSARALLEEHKLSSEKMDSVVLIDQGKVYQKSDAILRLAGYLKGPVRLMRAGWLVPRTLRDLLYDLIARKRYRWFGRRDACRLPEPGIKDRFLEMNTPSESGSRENT